MGRAKKVALAKAATQLLQQLVLFASLNALGHYIHSQHAGEFNDGANDLERFVHPWSCGQE